MDALHKDWLIFLFHEIEFLSLNMVDGAHKHYYRFDKKGLRLDKSLNISIFHVD